MGLTSFAKLAAGKVNKPQSRKFPGGSCLQEAHDKRQDSALVSCHVGRQVAPGEVGLQQGIGFGVWVRPLAILHSQMGMDQ